MNTFKDLVEIRHSVRAYSSKEIEKEKLEYIMECVRHAPSAVNFQPWYFYIVRSEKGKQKLQQCYPREWFNTAPLYILACADHKRSWHRKPDGKDHADIDICWVCNFDVALCASLFDLPTHLEPVAIIPIGYSDEKELRPHQRRTYTEIIDEL